MDIDITTLKTPCYLIDERLLLKNLSILKSVSDQTGCKILLAQKAFSMYRAYPLIGKYLSGTTASSLHEARLGNEEMSGETHIFSPAYVEDEFDEILKLCDHIVFNSFGQHRKFRNRCDSVECGIRINPEYSELDHAIYDPSAKYSRLGVTLANFSEDELDGIDGLHFHTLCEQNADVLMRTLKAAEEKFGKYIPRMKWVNFGGGHHITREDYDIELLVKCINEFRARYDADVYLEPGEAVALNAGFLVSSVLDIVENEMNIAILDASAACHMPDVLEMPYHPNIIGAGVAGEKAHTYRLAGNTCLAGDIIGDYSFNQPLKMGDKLVFCDMAHYTMCKNNTFNGINLPDIVYYSEEMGIETVKDFGYEDFKGRLS